MDINRIRIVKAYFLGNNQHSTEIDVEGRFGTQDIGDLLDLIQNQGSKPAPSIGERYSVPPGMQNTSESPIKPAVRPVK